MNPVVLTDLDDTLFQTMPKCPPGAKGMIQMSSLVDGTPSGFATTMQQRFLRWLEVGAVVPVTARGRDVLARVNIKQAPAICSNGGCILRDDGELDMAWHSELQELSFRFDPVAAVYHALTKDLCATRFRHWSVEENGLDLYIVIKSNEGSTEALAALELQLAASLPEKWRCHRNGNNLAYLPPWLGKRQAARYFIEEVRTSDPDRPIIGIGDSISDVGFMDLCDFAAIPTTSQLWAEIALGNNWIR